MAATSNKRQERRFFPTRKEMRLGRWSLTPNHDLKLTLARAETGHSKTFTLEGRILSTGPQEIIFAARGSEEDGLFETRLVRLEGRWQTDEWNRLTFLVKKGNREEPLLFEGAWEIGDHHEILYRYQKKEILSFRGVWEIREKGYLTYLLDLSGRSRFDFKATLESPSLLGKEGEIRYQVGIRLSGKRTLVREVVLFGKWKVAKEFSLSFEVEYDKGRRHAILFESSYRIGERNELIFALKDRQGSPLGIEVTFSRNFFEGEGKAFLRFYKDAVESRIEGGVRVPF